MPSTKSLIAALSLTLTLTAQEPAPEPVPTNKLLLQLKARKLDLASAVTVCDELRYRATRARLQACKVLSTRFRREQRQLEKDASRVLSRAERAASNVQKGRVKELGQQQVDALRAACLQVTRQRDLSKADIKKHIDPRVAQLRRALLPNVDDLFTIDDTLAAAIDDLSLRHADLREWHRLFRLMAHELELHPDAAKHFQKNPPPDPPGDQHAIADAVALAAFAGLPMTAQDKKALQANETLRGKVDEQELLGTLDLNQRRYLLGLPLVAIDTKLSDAARDHSKDMHEMSFFSHTSPVPGKERFGKRAANFGTSASSENIARGQSTGKGAIRGWWYSPGHHKNMLGRHRRTGLGRHEQTWTQMFGG